MERSPQLVIFDCDGVLVDSERIFNLVLRDDLATRGLDLQLKDCMALFVGGSMEAVVANVQAKGVVLPADWVDNIYAKVLAKLNEGVDPIPGIHALLMHLQSINIPFCVASNGPVHKMNLTLGQTNLLPFFEGAIFSAYEIQSWKPDPTLFLTAAKHFGIAPDNCVVIEDSINGVTGAINAKMPCLAYTPEAPNPAFEKLGLTSFDHMDKVIGLLRL